MVGGDLKDLVRSPSLLESSRCKGHAVPTFPMGDDCDGVSDDLLQAVHCPKVLQATLGNCPWLQDSSCGRFNT